MVVVLGLFYGISLWVHDILRIDINVAKITKLSVKTHILLKIPSKYPCFVARKPHFVLKLEANAELVVILEHKT